MTWTEYHYEGFADHDDPTKYENHVRQTGRFTATVWALHVSVPSVLVQRTLDEIETTAEMLGIELTGEYRALTEIDVAEPRTQLTVYYRASRPFLAVVHGRNLAKAALAGRAETDWRVTPAGNWNDVLIDAALPQRGGVNGPETATEEQGQPGEHPDGPELEGD